MNVSIIIPVFKVEDYIERCLQSVLQQDYDDIELILVDDCTSDQSMVIARNMLCNTKHTVRYVVHEKNSGLSAARNSGIREATGDCLYFLDSDDELFSKTAISSLVETLENTGADCVVGSYQQISDSMSYISKKYGSKRNLIGSRNIIQAFVAGDIPVMAWNKLIRRDFVLSHNLYFKEGLVNEDELWSFRQALEANIVALSGQPTYRYFIRGGSIMTDKALERIQSSIEIYNEIIQCCRLKDLDNTCIRKHLDHFAFNRYLAIMTLPVNTLMKKKLYGILRNYQRKVKRASTINEHVLHLHLLFSTCVGFYIMKTEARLYTRIKKGKL